MAPLSYVFFRVPVYRRDREPVDVEPPDLGRSLPGDPGTLQRADDGVGPLFHRRYWIDVTDVDLDEQALIDDIASHLSDIAPGEMSAFESPAGDHVDGIREGDELVVRLPGPWDGPVRCVERTPTSFRFATLQGHMEAGEIEFRASRTERGFLRFTIESWARSGSPLFDLLYHRVPVAREMQLLMWARFCQRIAKRSGGVVMSSVASATREM